MQWEYQHFISFASSSYYQLPSLKNSFTGLISISHRIKKRNKLFKKWYTNTKKHKKVWWSEKDRLNTKVSLLVEMNKEQQWSEAFQ